MSLRVTLRGNRHLSRTAREKIERKKLRVQDELEAILRAIAASYKRLINSRSGTLAASVVVFGFVPSRGRARMEVTAPHAASVEKGARPHVIKARRRAALRWVGSDGQVHFAKSVQHPGNPPGRQLATAVERNRRTLRPRVLAVLEQRD